MVPSLASQPPHHDENPTAQMPLSAHDPNCKPLASNMNDSFCARTPSLLAKPDPAGYIPGHKWEVTRRQCRLFPLFKRRRRVDIPDLWPHRRQTAVTASSASTMKS